MNTLKKKKKINLSPKNKKFNPHKKHQKKFIKQQLKFTGYWITVVDTQTSRE